MSTSVEPGAAARQAATRAVAAVVHGGRSLSDALPEAEAGLAGADRALIRELAYGALRWYGRLQAVTAELLARPLRPRDRILEPLLVVGCYQLAFTRIPAHAAVSATVAAADALGRPRARGLINGCLRRFQREAPEILQRVDREPATAAALPKWLYRAIADDWPAEREAVTRALLERPPMTLRVNRRATTVAAYSRELATAGLTARPVPGVADALILDRPVAVTDLPGFREGQVSVQDAAAQLAADQLAAGPGMRVLDACAAPGGKTAHLLERHPDLSVVALDNDPGRLARMAEGLERLGLEAEVLRGDAGDPGGWWDGRPFERILLDAPCSATGVIRRHPDIKWLRRAADIPALAEGQARLLRALWPVLAPGGRLVYATCSLLRAENEAVTAPFVAAHDDVSVSEPALPAGRATGVGAQILPGEAEMDGFYYACLTKH